jgi:hypothetical protein
MADFVDAGTGGEKVHEEILRFHGVIGAMNEDAGTMLGEDDVFDGEGGLHGRKTSEELRVRIRRENQRGAAERMKDEG